MGRAVIHAVLAVGVAAVFLPLVLTFYLSVFDETLPYLSQLSHPLPPFVMSYSIRSACIINLSAQTEVMAQYCLPEGTVRVMKYFEKENPRNPQ